MWPAGEIGARDARRTHSRHDDQCPPDRQGQLDGYQLGQLNQFRGDHAEAARLCGEPRPWTSDPAINGVADGYHLLGFLAQAQGRYQEASAHYERAVAIRKRTGDESELAITYHQLGMLARQQNQHDEQPATTSAP